MDWFFDHTGSYFVRIPYEVFEELTGVNIRNLMGYALIT
jgi:hypothetical protein